MLGHHAVWTYGWGLFLTALDEAAKTPNPAADDA